MAARLVRRNSRRSRRDFISSSDRATYETLHAASEAGRHLTHGLTDDGAERAAPYLRAVLGVPAVALCDPSSLIVWDGQGAPAHRPHAMAQAKPTLAGGQLQIIARPTLDCGDPECLIRTAIVAPIVVNERVTGTLTAYASAVTPALSRATGELARWVSVQVELADLERARTRAMEAELRALRAQISPHFIYNCLATIASFVRTDPDRARELLLEFADFTRYSLRQQGAFTTLRDELTNVERYLVLEQARFGDRLKVTLEIAPEVLPVSIPYLVLQPLVENAIRHGVAQQEGQVQVSIAAADVGSAADISVEDDGAGADPEHIRRILDGLETTDSLGLGNVDARLRQVYGDEGGLVLETAPGAGTRVTFRVPKYAPGVHA